MISKAELAAGYRARAVQSLGLDQEDPRAFRAAVARADRYGETLGHMEEPVVKQLSDLQREGFVVQGDIGGHMLSVTEGNTMSVMSVHRTYLRRINRTVFEPLNVILRSEM